MASPVEQIKERLNIVDVIGGYLKLERAGSSLKARCPFHNERTPSFFVSPARQSYYCFGCNRGGDLIRFVEEIEGVDFFSALNILAPKAGVTLRARDYAVDRHKDKLFEILNAAKNFFISHLQENKPVLAYLRGRGLDQSTIEGFELGFALKDWRLLLQHLTARGYETSLMEEAGLIVKSERDGGGFYDRFRSRIMFPIFDSLGRVVGFSGRLWGEEKEAAKYVNSPQTLLFDKSKILYGFHRAKTAIHKHDGAVLVEGQMDLLLSHQAGLDNSVAVSGTALTEHHLGLLQRLTSNLVMAFDGDSAGINAARRSIELALSKDFEVRVVPLPPGVDPADFVRKDAAGWVKACKEAAHVIDFLLTSLNREQTDRRRLGQAIRREVFPYLARLRSRLDQFHFLAKIADLIGLTADDLRTDFQDFLRRGPRSPEYRDIKPPAESQPVQSRQERIESRLFGAYWFLDGEPQLLIESGLKRILGENGWLAAFKRWQPQRASLALEAELYLASVGSEKIKEYLADLLLNLEKEKLRQELESATYKLHQAEAGSNQQLVSVYLKECQEVSRRLNSLL